MLYGGFRTAREVPPPRTFPSPPPIHFPSTPKGTSGEPVGALQDPMGSYGGPMGTLRGSTEAHLDLDLAVARRHFNHV